MYQLDEKKPTICNDYTATVHLPEMQTRNFYGEFIPSSNMTFSKTGTYLFKLIMNITDPTFDISNQIASIQIVAYYPGKCFHRWQFLISFCSFDNNIIII